MEYKVLNNGLKMPMVGLGVYKQRRKNWRKYTSWCAARTTTLFS